MESDLLKALKFAMGAHDGQMRKFQGVPYVWHPVQVATIAELYKPQSSKQSLLRIAALLHDTVEDTDITLQDIASEFGYDVASLVEELTSDSLEVKKIGKAVYLKLKMQSMSSYALFLKLCDRLANVMDFPLASESFKAKYTLETREILSHLFETRHLTASHLRVISEIKKYV